MTAKRSTSASAQQPLPDAGRSAGVLLHVTSLPSPFGTGDLGPQAYAFADFLSRAGQKYWQLLPLGPTEKGQGYSPYSSIAAMGGNPMLISPEQLVADGLLTSEEVEAHHVPFQDQSDFKVTEQTKEALFNKAYERFAIKASPAFTNFCKKERHWLDDFACYVVLKMLHARKPWYEWPDVYRFRQPKAMKQLLKQQHDALQKVKWLQYIFLKQWYELKKYCHSLNIRLFGDLPFYVSYDSADVWAHPEVFYLNDNREPVGIAGVPPDYFSQEGQLWGMPVFNWKTLKADRYAWWLQRIRKNMELYDLLRLDHFRAFADYWEVPAGERTAVNGNWKRGPGAAFFTAVKKELGTLPFVAEDLGDINDAVYALRDRFHLPGMKVLHFAFGDNMPTSDYIPHRYQQNFIVYTGTHDNNTTRGWFRQDLKFPDRKRLSAYCGKKVTDKDVHETLSRIAYASVAKTVILPLQDILGLDEHARMNMPASADGNWRWRFPPGAITKKEEEKLREWCNTYGR